MFEWKNSGGFGDREKKTAIWRPSGRSMKKFWWFDGAMPAAGGKFGDFYRRNARNS